MRMPPFPLIALATLFFFGGFLLLPSWWEASALFWLIGVGVTVYCVGWMVRNRRDPYSLEELQRVQEQEELRAIEEPDVPDDAGILCSCCGEPFSPRYPVCPHCGKSP